MSWKKLLQSNSIHRHTTSRQELSDIRRLVARDLADAAIPVLSEDRRFATAYNAALQTAKMAIACAGYRIASVPGHHRLTFEGAKLSLGKQAEQLADYLPYRETPVTTSIAVSRSAWDGFKLIGAQ